MKRVLPIVNRSGGGMTKKSLKELIKEVETDAWNAAVKQTKKACAEAITTSTEIDGYISLRPSDIVDIIMKVKVE